MSTSFASPLPTSLFVRDTCLCFSAQRAARLLARRFDAVFRPVGLGHGQFSLLCALNRPAPAPFADVAELLATDRTTLTAALKPLQRDGLVQVLTDPGDRRRRLLSLTGEGRLRLEAALPLWRAAHDALQVALGGGVKDVLRSLERIRDAA